MGDIAQVRRLVSGLTAYPELLTDLGGPDPRTLTMVPILLYAMPFAKPGTQDGVHSTDWSIITRFFERGDLGQEIEFGVAEGHSPVTHRQVTQRIWAGPQPTPDDLRRALNDPWPLKLLNAQTRAVWVYANLAPYQLARSADYVTVDLDRAALAELYGVNRRKWEQDLERAKRKAQRLRVKAARRELVHQTRAKRKARQHYP